MELFVARSVLQIELAKQLAHSLFVVKQEHLFLELVLVLVLVQPSLQQTSQPHHGLSVLTRRLSTQSPVVALLKQQKNRCLFFSLHQAKLPCTLDQLHYLYQRDLQDCQLFH